MKKYSISILFVFMNFVFGLVMAFSTIQKFQIERNPAAIRQVYDFSQLRGSALEVAMKQRLLTGLEINKDEEGIGISLGHFAFLTDAGEKTLGCHVFQKVVFQFESDETAVNGEKSLMDVEGPCEYSTDIGKIDPLWIPVNQVLAVKPADGDLEFREKKQVTLRFNHMADAWPRRWVLVGVKIVSPQKEVALNRNEVNQIMGKLTFLQW